MSVESSGAWEREESVEAVGSIIGRQGRKDDTKVGVRAPVCSVALSFAAARAR